MALVINTNVGSLNTQRYLSETQASLQTSMQRLSSGLRINTAADDSAGLAISDGMTSQINGMIRPSKMPTTAFPWCRPPIAPWIAYRHLANHARSGGASV